MVLKLVRVEPALAPTDPNDPSVTIPAQPDSVWFPENINLAVYVAVPLRLIAPEFSRTPATRRYEFAKSFSVPWLFSCWPP